MVPGVVPFDVTWSRMRTNNRIFHSINGYIRFNLTGWELGKFGVELIATGIDFKDNISSSNSYFRVESYGE